MKKWYGAAAERLARLQRLVVVSSRCSPIPAPGITFLVNKHSTASVVQEDMSKYTIYQIYCFLEFLKEKALASSCTANIQMSTTPRPLMTHSELCVKSRQILGPKKGYNNIQAPAKGCKTKLSHRRLPFVTPLDSRAFCVREGTEGKVPENNRPGTKASFRFGTADARVQQA